MLSILSTGVEIPNAVHHALEDERLVFFCGAGISVYTGLPGFRGLTIDLFRQCHAELAETPAPNGDQSQSTASTPGKPWDVAFWERKYDRASALLEGHVKHGVMRRLLRDILRAPLPETEKDFRLHRDLLDLSALKDGGHRIVTTNFDDRFHLAANADRNGSVIGNIPYLHELPS